MLTVINGTCVYGCAEPAQLYPSGWRCPQHTDGVVIQVGRTDVPLSRILPAPAPAPEIEVAWCAIFTLTDEGSVTVRHHTPADAAIIEAISTLAGPVIVKQMFSAEDRAAFANVPNGVTVVLDGGP